MSRLAEGEKAATETLENRPIEASGPTPAPGCDVEAFTCHRHEMPMIWVLGGLAAAELLIVHLLVSMWSGTAAWVLTLLTIAAVAQAAWMVRAMITRPVLVGERAVTIRFRTRTPIVVPVEDIVRVEDSALAPAPTGSGVFRGTLLAHPNVTLRLERPLAHAGRQIEVIALRIDAPEAFRAAVEARRARLRAGGAEGPAGTPL